MLPFNSVHSCDECSFRLTTVDATYSYPSINVHSIASVRVHRLHNGLVSVTRSFTTYHDNVLLEPTCDMVKTIDRETEMFSSESSVMMERDTPSVAQNNPHRSKDRWPLLPIRRRPSGHSLARWIMDRITQALDQLTQLGVT